MELALPAASAVHRRHSFECPQFQVIPAGAMLNRLDRLSWSILELTIAIADRDEAERVAQ